MAVRTNWRDDGACRDADPDLFFPIGTTGKALGQISEAKQICRVCQVQIQCLAWALENGVTDGVWGGTTDGERRAIRGLARSKTVSKEDDDGKSCYPAEHGEHGVRAQPAQSEATRIFGGAGIGPDAGGTGAMATSDGGRHQRRNGS